LGCKLEKEMVVCLLLLTLQESFNVVVTAIETLSDDKINVNFVRRRLLDEVAKRECKVESTTSNKNMNVSAAAFESSTFTYYYCKKPGHKKFQCRKYKADQNRSKKKVILIDSKQIGPMTTDTKTKMVTISRF